jgi:hypothetical protein
MREDQGGNMNKAIQHSPGPWIVETDKIHIRPQGENATYGAGKIPDQTAANARLIAAAPDLLAALVAWKAHGFAVPISDHPEAVAQRKLHALVDAAIAKAKGAA